MKKATRFFACLLVPVFICACTPREAVVTDTPDTTSVRDTSAETTEAPEAVQADIEVRSAAVADGSLTVVLSVSGEFEGKLRYDVVSDSGSGSAFTEGVFTPGTEYSLTASGMDAIGSTYTVTCYAVCGGEVIDTAEFSYLNGLPQLSADDINIIVSELTVQEKASLLIGWSAVNVSGAAAQTYAVERLGIPSLTFADGPAGLRISEQTVAYPTGTVLASSWDDALVSKVTASMGEDCKLCGVDILLAPGLNLQKNVLNGRNFEYFSEDPFLTGMIASAYINGVQSSGTGVAMKHYAANNQETARGQTSSEATERALRELYLRGFGYAVKYSDPYSVMTSYNRVNGTYASGNSGLVSGILFDEFGFGGFVMTDWGASSGGRANMISARNAMFCGGSDNEGDAAEIVRLLADGTLELSQVDLCVSDFLKTVVRSNTFSGAEVEGKISKALKTQKKALVRQAAAESAVLLKNEGALPFANCEVALFGNAAVHTLKGGYGSGGVNVSNVISITAGLKKAEGITLNETVYNLYKNCSSHAFTAAQSDNPQNDTLEIAVTEAQAKAAAAEADVAVMVISRITTEGTDHSSLEGDYLLNSVELQTLENISSAFHAAGKKVVMVLNTGNPIEVASWRDSVDAILYCGLCGEQIGYSVADVLTGAVNPSGKLTATFPMSYADTPASEYFPGSIDDVIYYEDIYVGYRYYETFNIPVAYEFGYGLSYTSFEYSDFTVSESVWDGSLTMSVKVTNTGSVAGREAVQFYVSKPDGKNEQASIELCGYGKTSALEPGASEIITVTLSSDELRTYYTEDSAWIIEAGDYTLSVGASVRDIKFKKTLTVASEITVLDTENKLDADASLHVITKSTGKESAVYGENLALNKPSYCDSSENSGYSASMGNDGSFTTRWSRGSGTDHWWYVDLGQSYALDAVRIRWESNIPGFFELWLSEDGENWTLYTKAEYHSINTVDVGGKTARYVKCAIPGGGDGWLSFFELEVYGK